MQRRDFVKLGGVMAATAAAASQMKGYAAGVFQNTQESTDKQVDFIHDGLQLSPKEYAALLMKMADEGKIKPDYYSNGGVVEELENKFAKLLGKESAVFMPTGTLANHIAVRRLADHNRRIIVQEQSHLYNDEGDCAETLSGLNLIPVGENSTEFTMNEVENIINKSKKGRVELRVGAISIETPVRRQQDRMFSFDGLKAITAYAKTNDIKTHLDGARIFVQAAHTNMEPARYGELFDTAYTSLWKCFNAASGAVLAGSKTFTTNLFHERRMFGGSLPAAWAFAAVALYYTDTFIEDYKAAWQNAEKFFSDLQKEERFKITKYENGSHVVRLSIKNVNLAKFSEALLKKNIQLPVPDETGFNLKINPSLNRLSSQQVMGKFMDSLREAG